MQLGAFSVSLAARSIEASSAFHEEFGFKVFGGDASRNWLILKNGDHGIGLSQGMFERNTLTFDPGWGSNAGRLPEFTDVRELRRRLKEPGVKLVTEADEQTTGPAGFIAIDPGGSPILVDQHVWPRSLRPLSSPGGAAGGARGGDRADASGCRRRRYVRPAPLLRRWRGLVGRE
jgi:lactoylglutathione lyase